MPSYLWSKLSPMQLGRYAEYYAKMEFASHGFEIYSSEVDDHGVDFIVKKPSLNNTNKTFYEIQVKSLRESNKGNYVFIPKTKMNCNDKHYLVCFLHFAEKLLPTVYLFPATTWKKQPSGIFASRNYPDKKRKPEWGLIYSKKNLPALTSYLFDTQLAAL